MDTSAIIAVTNAQDPEHAQVATALLAEPTPWLVPAGILGEVGYMLESMGLAALEAFLEDLQFGPYTLDCQGADLTRIRELVRRYQDLRLGFSDASVISCAERNGGRVLTLDQRDFQVVAREGTISVVSGGD